LLNSRSSFVAHEIAGVGDFDIDGYPDYAVSWDGGLGTFYFQVWSPYRNQNVLQISRPREGGQWEVLAGMVDLNGDAQPDLLIGSSHTSTSIYAYDHSGSLLYSIPITSYGLARAAAGVGDLDGDGCDDFVIGIDWYDNMRGAIALVSGRTGTIVRITPGELPGDRICYPLAAAGDVDRDGLTDYVTGNYFGENGRGLINVYSGATGTIIRQWVSTTADISTSLLPGPDADLDGLPDMISGSVGFPNSPLRIGRVQVFSSRDQQVLAHTEPNYDYARHYAEWIADLGVQPGSPYPVIAFTDRPLPVEPYRRIQAWRLSPPGVQVVGNGCASSGTPPTIGVRRVTGATGETSRITLGSGLPAAPAWCLLGPASSTATFPLAPLGFPGCTLLVEPCIIASRIVGLSGFDRGYAGVDLPGRLPGPFDNDYAPTWAAQWLLLDPLTLSHAATPRHEFWLR
jgi:hypothetical protein